MKGEDLFFIGDEVLSFLGIACDGGAGYRELQAEVELDGGVDDGIEPEDLLLSVGVLRVEANPDAGVLIGGKPGAAKEEGICLGAVPYNDAGDCPSLDHEIETGALKLLLEREDLIEDAWLVGIGFLEGKGEDLHLWFHEPCGEPCGGALCPDADFFAHDESLRISESIENPLADVLDDTLELDHLAVFAEMGAAFIPRVGGEKGAVGGQDLKGEETQKVCDLHQGMEDDIVQGLAQTILEIGEGSLTRNEPIADPCIEPVVLSPDGIPQHVYEGLHVRELFEVVEELQEKQTDRIVGEPPNAIGVGYDRSDKGEIDQGRDEPGQPADKSPIGVNLDVATFELVLREPELLWLGERAVVLGMDMDMDAVEFFEDVAQAEGSEVSPQAPSPSEGLMAKDYAQSLVPGQQRC